MKQYEAYKDSGIQWLGEIPNHWEIAKLKHKASCNDDVLSENTDADSIIRYVEISDVDASEGIKCSSLLTFGEAPSRARRITRVGDVIVSTVRTYLKAIASINEDGLIVSTGFAVIRPQKINSSFLKYSLLNDGFIGEVISRSVGVSYPAITSTELMGIDIIVPPMAEQEVIAAYLDQKVGKINAVIAEKEAMMEQLTQYRKSLISETVTRGLDPNVPMKDTGIEWLGQIPEHWQVMKLKYSGTFENGLTYSPSDVVDDGILVLRSSNIQNQKLAFEDNVFVENAPKELFVKHGDIIICSRNGSANLVGKCAFVEDLENATFGAFMMRYRPNIHSKFAFYAFQSATDFYKGLYSTSTINQITKGVIDQMYVAIPPNHEQQSIAEKLDADLAKIDLSISCLQSQIEDLRKYKTSVISEAVTGKVDLRDWKPSEITT